MTAVRDAAAIRNIEALRSRRRFRRYEGRGFAGRLRRKADRDAHAAALGESWRGASRGKHDAIVLIVGTGIGTGIVSGGRLIRGARELSGCAGWLVVTEEYDEEARRSGTLESRAAGPALGRAFEKAIRR